MKTGIRIPICFLFISIILFAAPGFCGLLVTEADGRQSLVSQGKFKVEVGNGVIDNMILDYKKGTLVVLNHSLKTAMTGTIDKYCEIVNKQSISSFDPNNQAPIDVRVEEVGEDVVIAGYPTVKYRIYVNGKLYEEEWISKDKTLTGEIGDVDQYARFEKCASQKSENPVEASDPYQQLIKTGWVLKSIDYEQGEPAVVVDVQTIEVKEVPESDFDIPAGYQIKTF